jgi:hypothetical protein
MARAKRVNLHGINRAIRDVQSSLRQARTGVSADDRSRIQELISRLEELRTLTSEMCPRAWAIWPPSAAAMAAKAPAKPRAKSRR